jgi:hypothetical protein
MSCRVKRINGQIAKVTLENGKESETYHELVKAAENMPDELHSYVYASLKPFEGKHIKDIVNPQEIALGLYMQLHTESFKKFFGNWENDPESVFGRVTETGEPKVTIKNGLPSFIGINTGDFRSVYNNGLVTQSYQNEFKSIKTKRFNDLLTSVKQTKAVLDSRMEEAINKKQIAKLDESLNKEQRIERINYYNSIIEKVNKDRDTLTRSNSVDAVFIQASTDIDMANKMLNGVSLSVADARFGERTSRFWTNLHETLGITDLSEITDPANRKLAEDLVSKAQSLQKRFANLAIKNLQEQSKQEFGEENMIQPKDLKSMIDVNVFSGQTRDASTTQSPVVNLGAKIIHDTNMAVNRQRNANIDKIVAAQEKIKNHPEFVKNGYNIFFAEEKNADGLMTLALRTPFSKDYSNSLYRKHTELESKLDKAGDNKVLVKKAYNEHNTWIKKNTIAFDAVPFIETDAKGIPLHSEAERIKVIDNMVNEGFSREEIAHMVKDAGIRYNKFKEDSYVYRYDLSSDILHGNVEVPKGMTEDQFIDEKVKEWEDAHDPISFQRFTNNEQPFNTAYKGYKYAVAYPRKLIDGKNTDYYDQEFRKISADTKLHEFYHFFKDFISENLSYLPEELTDKLGSNFLPVVSNGIAKDMGLSGVKGALNGIDEWMMKLLTITDQADMNKIDPIDGRVKRSIRPRFLSENVPVEGRSKDMVAMMKIFSDMATMYKHKIQVQDQVETLLSLVQDVKNTTVKGNHGEEKSIAKSPDNIKNMFDSTVVHSFYAAGKDAEGVMKGRKFWNSAELLTLGLYKSKEYKLSIELEKNIKETTAALDNENLTIEERAGLEESLLTYKKSYTDLGGREFAVSRAADSLVQGARFSTMAVNPFSALRNLVFGGISNRIHAFGGIDFNMKELNKATFMMRDSIKKHLTWSDKGSAFAEKLLRVTLDAGVIENRDKIFAGGSVSKSSSLDQIKKVIPSPYGMLSSGDYLFKGELGIAMMLGKKVKTKSGEHILLDVMNSDLSFNEEKFGKFEHEANGAKDFADYYKKFLNNYSQTAKQLHGFFGDTLSISAKNTVVGRMLFLFKTFLPETVATRFEGNRYDPLLQRRTEGFYRTFGRELAKNPIEAFKTIFDAVTKNGADGMTPLQVNNLRKMFMEMGVMATLSALYMTLRAIGPNSGDDDDKRKRYNVVVNQLLLINRNLSYFINPSSFKDLTQNVFPVLQTIDNYGAAMKAVAYYGFSIEDKNGHEMYDGDKTIKRVTKALPFLNNYNRIINYSKDEMKTGN